MIACCLPTSFSKASMFSMVTVSSVSPKSIYAPVYAPFGGTTSVSGPVATGAGGGGLVQEAMASSANAVPAPRRKNDNGLLIPRAQGWMRSVPVCPR